MKIVFESEVLRTECNNQELLVKRYGSNLAQLLRQRLDELFNAEFLEDMRSMPHVSITNLHGVPGDLALEIGPAHRLVFRPHPFDSDRSGPSDWNKINSLIILGVRENDAKPYK